METALTVVPEAEPPSRGVPGGRSHISLRFTFTMLCDPMLVLVDDEKLARRKDRRAPRPS
ncbi:hypothetical protein [Nonomuraea sp. NPDC049784]|uniref:hypothetical protein n=1 Tax=Nonomuraea sp. NPDC049784 TaxID=3154361 RepID=UPI0034004AC9